MESAHASAGSAARCLLVIKLYPDSHFFFFFFERESFSLLGIVSRVMSSCLKPAAFDARACQPSGFSGIFLLIASFIVRWSLLRHSSETQRVVSLLQDCCCVRREKNNLIHLYISRPIPLSGFLGSMKRWTVDSNC